MKRLSFGVVALGLLVAVAWPAAPQHAATPADRCEALKAAALPDRSTVITAAAAQSAVPSPGGATPAPLAHCEVLGKLQERRGANGQTYAVRFHVRLPADWNGRLFFQGGGGSNGVIGDALGNLMGAQPGNALAHGYAVVSQDSGHDNAINNDPARQGVVTFGWDAEARRNYGGASIGPVVRAAKALVRAFYGHAPAFTYYAGRSKGGQEAMMAAERFPEEFDAVLVGYPGFRLAYAGAVGQMWDAQAFAAAAREAGQMGPGGVPPLNRAFTDDDLLLASGAVLRACDELDGTMDGMVENFAACNSARVTPALEAVTCKGAKEAACLAPAQVAALRKVIEGARGRDGRLLYADWPWDAGIAARTAQGVTGGWRAWKIGAYASPVNNGLAAILGGASTSAVFTSPPVQVADDPAALTTYALEVDVEANAAKVAAKWGSFNESAADFMDADATDLSRFTRRGGRMLIYHGVSDPVFSINDTIAWWKAVDARLGGHAADVVRLFAVPGMNHGGGGPSTDQFDAFGALVAWREHGVAPTQMVATARANTPWPGRTRLLCPYPQQPRRTGADIESAASFHCVTP